MSKHTLLHGAEANIEQMFATLPDAAALRLFEKLSDRFSFSYGHDKVSEGIDQIASDLGDALGYEDYKSILDPTFTATGTGIWL